jgi:hypothetical protein
VDTIASAKSKSISIGGWNANSNFTSADFVLNHKECVGSRVCFFNDDSGATTNVLLLCSDMSLVCCDKQEHQAQEAGDSVECGKWQHGLMRNCELMEEKYLSEGSESQSGVHGWGLC